MFQLREEMPKESRSRSRSNPFVAPAVFRKELGEGAYGLVESWFVGGDKVAVKWSWELGVDEKRISEICTEMVLQGICPHLSITHGSVGNVLAMKELENLIEIDNIRKRGTLKQVAVQMLVAVAALHKQGIVHNDLNESNWMFSRCQPQTLSYDLGDGQEPLLLEDVVVLVTVIDFGSSRVNELNPAEDWDCVFLMLNDAFYRLNKKLPYGMFEVTQEIEKDEEKFICSILRTLSSKTTKLAMYKPFQTVYT